jgi:alpha 1,2-mannosyltransferase
MYEYEATIPTMWGHVMGAIIRIHSHRTTDYSPVPMTIDFVKAHPEYIAKDNALGFMSSDNGNTYNLCHCTPTFSPSTFKLYHLSSD